MFFRSLLDRYFVRLAIRQGGIPRCGSFRFSIALRLNANPSRRVSASLSAGVGKVGPPAEGKGITA